MPKYSSRDAVRSGMPLGGIGTGKIELTPYGTLDYFSILNNWQQPLCNVSNPAQARAQGLAGFHFAVRVKTPAAVLCKLLQTEKIGEYPCVSQIRFDAQFPQATLDYIDDNLPVRVQLRARSFFTPQDISVSGLPAAVFEFSLTNPLDREVEVGVMAMFRNIIGRYCVGRFNTVRQFPQLTGIEFSHIRPLAHDQSAGTIFLGVPLDAGQISTHAEWNMQKDYFVFEPHVQLPAFETFCRQGRLPDTPGREPVASQSVELGGALAVSALLGPQETRTVPFLFAWNVPGVYPGHYYERNFRGSAEVAVHVQRHVSGLTEQMQRLPQTVAAMGLEPWLTDALLNNLYPLVSSSWLTRRGEFALYESPVVCPLLGTLDVYFYAGVAVGLLFPSLDCQALLPFKKFQRRDGYVPHDLGLERLDLASNGTTRPLWKDLNSKFILSIYRAYLMSGNRNFLKTMYPAMKRALAMSSLFDRDADGLPEAEGWDTTFDTWGFRGANCYVGAIYLVSLLVMRTTAELFQDKRLAQRCRDRFLQARTSFEEKLWTGSYYRLAHSDGGTDEACMLAQLTGQWYAHLLGFGRIFSEERIKSAISTVLRLNATASEFGAVNAVSADGAIDQSSYHSRNIWPGICYSFAALAIYEGFVDEALAVVKTVWQTISVKNSSPWNQPDVIISQDGSFGFGDYYMRNLVIWALVPALASQRPEVAQALEQLRRMGPASGP